MYKYIILIFLLLLSVQAIKAQDYETRFEKLMTENDTAKTATLLKEWEQKKPEDPQLYVAWFNYLFQKSREGILVLTTDTTGENGLMIKEKEGGEAAGML